MPQTAKFGTAERAAEQKRFLSDAHAHAALGQRTPGPGYLLSSGKGIPNTFGDAPEWRFSTGPRAEVVPRDAPGTPGPGEYPKELHWEAAGGRFSPVRSRPGTQYRKPGKEEFISHDHFAVDNPEWRHTPGPGRYGTDPLEVESIRSTLRSKAAEVDPALRKLRDRAGLNPDFSKSGKPFDPARSAFISEDLLQRGATDALYDTR